MKMCHDGATTCLISNFLSNLIDLLIGRIPRQVPVHPVHGILALHDEEEYNGDVLLVQDVSQVLVTGNMERMGGKNLARQAGETSHCRNGKLCGLSCLRTKADSLLLKQVLRMMEDKEATHHDHLRFWLGKFLSPISFPDFFNYPRALISVHSHKLRPKNLH